MAKDITISPKHGLNPCIPVCFFCGEQKQEIALLGRLKGDAEAPMSAVLDYTPCDRCQANWNMGVPLIRVSGRAPQENMPPIGKHNGAKLYPTGQYSVMTPDAVKRIFDMEREPGAPVMVEDVMYDNLMASAKESGAIDENGNAVTAETSE